MNLRLIEFREALEKSWDINTTFCPDKWSTNNRAMGQCAVSSLLLQEQYGWAATILSADVILPDGTKERHYWNTLDGIDVDLTWRQFPEGSSIDTSAIKQTDKEYLLSNDWFTQRYEKLKTKFNAELQKLGRVAFHIQ